MTTRFSTVCIGNFAIDIIETSNGESTTPGGAGLRFISAWALYGLPIEAIAVVGNEPIWDDTIALLEQNRVGTHGIRRTRRSLRFTTRYDSALSITGFSVENAFLMTELAESMRYGELPNAKLVHICPFECKEQIALIEAAGRLGGLVSSMIHYSSLSRQTRTSYQEAIAQLDYLFLNEEEAQFILGTESDWATCGEILSQDIRKVLFLTLDSRGAAAFVDGSLVAFSPPAGLLVRDVLGAGDCFAGGALAALMLSDDPLTALRCGSVAAAFALADIGHTPLLRFLKHDRF